MHRTCVSEGGGDVQLLQRLDQIPQKTENIFLAASHGADSPLHFEIEFGISLLELVGTGICNTASCVALP